MTSVRCKEQYMYSEWIPYYRSVNKLIVEAFSNKITIPVQNVFVLQHVGLFVLDSLLVW